MPKVCPPGFICIENMTIVFLLVVLVLAVFVLYKFIDTKSQNQKRLLL